MRTSILLGTAGLVGAAIVIGQLDLGAVADTDGLSVSRNDLSAPEATPIGGAPDVIVGDLPGITHWTSGGAVNGMRAYSIGTTSCNIGTVPLNWFQNGTQHPVIGQSIYAIDRFDGGSRIRQVGQSWLKHGFCALQDDGLCAPACQPVGPFCETQLGVGCQDPYGSGLNGDQGGLGPKYQVNPTTGAFIWPYAGINQTGNAIFKRVQVDQDDLVPISPDHIYIIEGQYIHPQDALANFDNNNASWRRANVNTNYSMTPTGGTQQMEPAVLAWKDHGGGINVPDNQIIYSDVNAPDGRYIIGQKVWQTGPDTFHYEFAVTNLNSDRGGASFVVPVLGDVVISNVGQWLTPYHSGETQDGSAWTFTQVAGEARWEMTAGSNNALNWGTTYNFWFDADAPPKSLTGQIDYNKGGPDPDFLEFNVLGPEAVPGADCVGDFDGSTEVDFDDLSTFLGEWTGDLTYDPCPPYRQGDFDENCIVNFDDLSTFLGAWGPCP